PKMALAEAKLLRDSRDGLPVAGSGREQARCTPDQIGLPGPFGRAGARVRSAALAGSIAGGLGCGRARVEADVRTLRHPRGAARPAVDAGRGDGCVEHSVVASVTARAEPVTGLELIDHGSE